MQGGEPVGHAGKGASWVCSQGIMVGIPASLLWVHPTIPGYTHHPTHRHVPLSIIAAVSRCSVTTPWAQGWEYPWVRGLFPS